MSIDRPELLSGARDNGRVPAMPEERPQQTHHQLLPPMISLICTLPTLCVGASRETARVTM
jgi:hypothetical protein